MQTIEKNEVALIPQITALELFQGGKVRSILDMIKEEALSVVTDPTTEKGRKEIASLAHKVARTKVALDEMGKSLTDEQRKLIDRVNEERRVIRDELDALKEEIRQPLTEYENREKERVEGHERRIAAIAALDEKLPGDSAGIAAVIAHAKAIDLDSFQEFRSRAETTLQAALHRLQSALTIAKETEERRAVEEAERRRLESERIERERIEREEREARIAAEAAEKARREAEAEARKAEEAREAERKAEADRLAVIEREKAEAEARAKFEAEARAEAEMRAERDRLIAEERLRIEVQEAEERARREAEERRKREVAEANERAKREAEQREFQRIAAERAEKERAEKIAANRRHRDKIRRKAVESLVSAADITEPEADRIISIIDAGQVEGVSINY